MINSSVCKNCKKKCTYNQQYDSLFCKRCNIWNEKICSDEKCFFCALRPDVPMLGNQIHPPKKVAVNFTINGKSITEKDWNE